MLEPVYVGNADAEPVKALLTLVATDEKHWPESEVQKILQMAGQFIGVFLDGKCVGGTQITYQRPFPCEVGPFNFVIRGEDVIPCEVTLIAVDRQHRRSAVDMGTGALDALVKGLYRFHRSHGGTHIYSLCEEWTFRVLTTGYVGIVGRKVSDGIHYWCGTQHCPSTECRLTHVCELDMRASERNWSENRPSFWEYLNEG